MQHQDRYLAVCDECGKPQTVRLLDETPASWASGGSCPCGATAFTLLDETSSA